MQIRRRIKTEKPESEFDKTLEQELLSAWLELATLVNGGLTIADNCAVKAQNHIENADGSLGDLTTKFNTLLASLEAIGILKTS